MTVASDALRLLAVATCGLAVACSGGGASDAHDESARVGTTRSAIVGGAPSTTLEDFVVLVVPDASHGLCGGVLVAPNLVITARHCVANVTVGSGEDASFDCLPNGEPAPGGGGVVLGNVPPATVRVIGGLDARGKWDGATSVLRASLGVGVKQILDDGAQTRCSHDIAALVLDAPLTGLPIAKLRLHERPAVSERFAIAGWGEAEGLLYWPDRRRRDDLVALRVGPPRFDATATSSPRVIETTAGACFNDSGGPLFDPAAGSAVGIIARGHGFLNGTPGSVCATPGAFIASTIIADFGDLLHRAFEAAGAKPLVENRETPGWASFGDACQLDALCGSNVCLKETGAASGTCNVDCGVAACPNATTCDAKTRRCVTPKAAPAPGEQKPDDATAAPVSARANDCAVRGPIGTSVAGDAAVLGFAAALALIARRRRSSRGVHA